MTRRQRKVCAVIEWTVTALKVTVFLLVIAVVGSCTHQALTGDADAATSSTDMRLDLVSMQLNTLSGQVDLLHDKLDELIENHGE